MAILVQFPYNADKVNRIKSLPGARWDAKRQGWFIPNTYKAHAERLLSDGPPVTVALPPSWTLHTAPWAHQQAALEYAYPKPAALLHMGLGTGKTKVAIDIIFNRQHQKTLIVCPKSVIPVWKQQLKRHTDLPYAISVLDTGSVKENLKRARDDMKAAAAYFTTPYRCWPWIGVTNYEAVWHEPFATWALEQQWDCLILDEIQRIKAAGGRASRFLYRLGFQATQRLGLSGTPIPHSPLDAYGVYRFLDPSIFGTNYKKFAQTYAVFGGFNNYQVTGYQNTAEFQQKFDSIRFRVDRSVLDLPEVQHIDIPITLPENARKIYKALEKDFYAQVDEGEVTVANALVKILRLAQITSGYTRLDADDDTSMIQPLHSAKADALKDIISGLDPDEPLVVFARFRYDLESICRAATACDRLYYELSGSYKELDKWREETGAVLGVQIGAGAEGIDLTKARYCVFFSISLSLAQYDQALARVHRPGQASNVTYYHLIAPGTVDSQGYKALNERRDVIEAIVNGGKQEGGAEKYS
jgi:SNF2 family DNA or RNA helicase